MPPTFYVRESDKLSAGAINRTIWTQGFAGYALPPTHCDVVKGHVDIGCAVCRQVVVSFAVHDPEHGLGSKLPPLDKHRNQVAVRKLRAHVSGHGATTGSAIPPAPRKRREPSTSASDATPVSADHICFIESLDEPRLDDHVRLYHADPIPSGEHRVGLAMVSNSANHNRTATDSDLVAVERDAKIRRTEHASVSSEMANRGGPGSTMTSHSLFGISMRAGDRNPQALLDSIMQHPGSPVQLPCMMQLDFHHAKYGAQQVWAMLVWVDLTAPQSVSNLKASGSSQPSTTRGGNDMERFAYVNRDKKSGAMVESRGLYLHRIMHVMPLGSPLAIFVGEEFSSLQVSARWLGHPAADGEQAWHLVFQPHMTMRQIITVGGLFNPDVADAIQRAEQDTSMPDHARKVKAYGLLSLRPSTEADARDADEGPLLSLSLGRQQTIPGWVPLTKRKRFKRACERGLLRPLTLRDLMAAASQCDECNDLECDIPDELENADIRSALHQRRAPTYRCLHGITHSPYLGHNTVKHVASKKRSDEDAASFRARKQRYTDSPLYRGDAYEEDIDAYFLVPKPRARGQPRSSWECRIDFHCIQTIQQLQETRVFAPYLLTHVIEVLATYRSEAFLEMMRGLDSARTIRCLEGLNAIDCSHDLWSPTRQRYVVDDATAKHLELDVNHDRIERHYRWKLSNVHRPPVRIPKHMQTDSGPSVRFAITWRMLEELQLRHTELFQVVTSTGAPYYCCNGDSDSVSESDGETSASAHAVIPAAHHTAD